mmetsp:Transcript_54585/g.130387  ORF Transcript_54585/g.130387 Transcript_54585/m.130387 type:complete len:361 (-) Transcript_54585:83-1165(-)
MWILLRRCLRGEGVGKRRTESDEGDGGAHSFNTEATSEYRSDIADHSRDEADGYQRAAEANPTSAVVCRWNEGENDFPWQLDDVESPGCSFRRKRSLFGLVSIIIVVAIDVEESILELVPPVDVASLGTIPSHDEGALDSVDGVANDHIRANENRQDAVLVTSIGRLVKLCAALGLLEEDAEHLRGFVPLSAFDRQLDLLLALSVEELQGSLHRLEVVTGLRSGSFSAELARDLSGGALHPLDQSFDRNIGVHVGFHINGVILVVESQNAGNVFVNDLDGGDRNISQGTLAKSVAIDLGIEELAGELLLILGTVVVNNLNLKGFLDFVGLKAETTFNRHEVFVGRCSAVFRPEGNACREV